MIRVIVLFSLVLGIPAVKAADIRVASAANFYPTLSKIKSRFEKNTEHRVTIIRGSTGKLYAQIINGAPYDMFLSADSVRVDKLVTLGVADNDESLVYAIGQLAVWNPKANSPQQVKEQLLSNNIKKLAVANPRTAPYGKAAIETLKNMGLYGKLKSKLVFGENISQTLQFVQSGAADLGFVARAHMKDRYDESQYWNITENQHQPIKQKMIVLKKSKHINAARAFMHFLQQNEIKQLIKNDGYQL